MLFAALALGLLHCGSNGSALFAQPTCADQAAACIGSGGSAATTGGAASTAGGANGGGHSGGSTGASGPASGGAGAGGSGNSSGGAGLAGAANGGMGTAQGGTPAIAGAGAGGGASGGNSACVTAFSAGTLKFGFDTAPGAGVATYPADSTGEGSYCTGPVSHGTALYTATEGHQCPGALEVTIPFGQYLGLNTLTAAINFSSADWRTYSLLHVWVKLRAPDIAVPNTNPLTYLGQVRLSVASSSAGLGTSNYLGYSSADSDIAPFSDRQWHELTLPLPASGSYYPDAVVNVGVQLTAQPSAPADGPDAPPDTVVEIDDIWVE